MDISNSKFTINLITLSIHHIYTLVMTKVHWKIFSYGGHFINWLKLMYNLTKLTLVSMFYNDFADKYYIGDTCMEPMFWLVDHFTKVLGPICVVAVILFSSSLIIIAYAVGLPFYLQQNSIVLVFALLLGHWLLANVVFYYYMAYITDPGYPPQGAMITEAVTICKRCIAPKPPRTHHCIVCNRCILKMDHHCPWLNNCVGHFNHRYFFMFCAYTWIGVVFVIMFGIPVFYSHLFGSSEYGFSPLFINFLKNVADNFIIKQSLQQKNYFRIELKNSTTPANNWADTLYHSCIVYAALLCVAVLCVLGGLLAWHARLISKGETSIEGHINKTERIRALKEGTVYKNPYDFGAANNWKVFLGVGYNRSWWHLLFPFAEPPFGDGINWNIPSDVAMSIKNRKEISETCFVKMS